jgi:hypothetical protein
MGELAVLSPITEQDIERNKQLGWPDLSAQKKQFARVYLETYNPKRAAEHCGLPKAHAHLLVREPLVAAFIEELESGYAARSFLTKEMVLIEQLEVLEKLQGREEVPIVDKEGGTVHAKKFHAAETVKFLADLAKQTGASTASGGAGSGVSISINFGDLVVSKPPEVAVQGETIEHG